MDRHLAAMRAEGAAVVHLSPHAGGEPDVGVDNVAGIAAMVAALVAPRAPADRVPRRAPARCSSPATASRATGAASPRPGLALRRAARRPHAVRPRRRRAGRRHAAGRRGAVHRGLLRQRPPGARGARAPGRARDRRPGRRVRRGLRRHLRRGADRARALDRPRCRCARWAAAASAHADRILAGEPEPHRRRCRRASSCATPPPPRRPCPLPGGPTPAAAGRASPTARHATRERPA